MQTVEKEGEEFLRVVLFRAVLCAVGTSVSCEN